MITLLVTARLPARKPALYDSDIMDGTILVAWRTRPTPPSSHVR